MTIKINYLNKTNTRNLRNLVLFTDELYKIGQLKQYLSSSEFSYTQDLLKNSDVKKRILIFNTSSKKKVILVSIKKDLKSFEIENLGAEFFGKINLNKKNTEYFLISNSIIGKNENSSRIFLTVSSLL